MNIYEAVTDAGLRPAHDFFNMIFLIEEIQSIVCGPG